MEEQERIRSALQHTLNRYTLQIETASEVAQATVSILELGELLSTAVDLIRERFALDYVGIYLVDPTVKLAVLRAATGNEGHARLAVGHRLIIEDNSTIGQCLVQMRPLIIGEGTARGTGQSSWLAETRSEVAIPLISRGRTMGALTVQSTRVNAFYSQDVPGFQIMADQLANAIENARLFADARRRADELAIAYQQMQELDKLKDQFMQNVSHELRTPLTIIGGYAELLTSGELGPLQPDQMEGIRVIARYSQDLRELVSDIMSILEVRARQPVLATVHLGEAAHHSMADFGQMASDRAIRLRAEIPEAADLPLVMARPEHIRRILDNLLSNALKFTPEGGEVGIRIWHSDGLVGLAVQDTGIGIAPDLLDRVFDRFFQVDGSLRRRYGGTGLGLSLVKELVESYGGIVTAASDGLNKGTTFTVLLPAAEATAV